MTNSRLTSLWAAIWAVSLIFACFVLLHPQACDWVSPSVNDTNLTAVNSTLAPPEIGLIEVMPPDEREAVARELVHRKILVVALVFYGRRESVSILNSYLERNLRRNGGIIDRVHFIVATDNLADLRYLMRLIDRNPNEYEENELKAGVEYDKHYRRLQPDTMYFKIDDDTVFIADGTFEAMAQERLRNRFLILSANVVNHPLGTFIQGRHFLLHPYVKDIQHPITRRDEIDWRVNHLPPERHPVDLKVNPPRGLMHRWVPLDGAAGGLSGTAAVDATYHSFDECGWASWECGAIAHYSLFRNVENGQLPDYDFGVWDFHSVAYDRFSINFLCFFGRNITKYGPVPPDDEQWISSNMAEKAGIHNGMVARAVVSHYAYGPQREGLGLTDILDKYRALALEATGIMFR